MTRRSLASRQRRRLVQMFQAAFAPRIAPERQGEALKALLNQFEGEAISSITRAEFVIRAKYAMKPFLPPAPLGQEHPVVEMKRIFDEVLPIDANPHVARLVDVCTLTEEEEEAGIKVALYTLDDAANHLRIAMESLPGKPDVFFEQALEMLVAARHDLARLTGIAVERTSAPTEEDAC